MFGISPIGWLHTLGSLPAIPVMIYMFVRSGRIVPRSAPGIVYFVSMLIGSLTVFLVAHSPASFGIGVVTLVLLLAGYGISLFRKSNRPLAYLETILLSLTALLLMAPTVSETLRRVPDGHPIVTDVKSPILAAANLTLLVIFITGLTAQILSMRRKP